MRERRRSECDREGRSSNFRRKMRPIIAVAASPSAARSRSRAPRATLGSGLHEEPDKAVRPQSLLPFGLRQTSAHCVALLGIVDQAMTCVMRLVINPDFTSNALREGFVQRFLTRCQNTFSDNTETQTKTQDGQKYFLSAVSLRLARFSCFK